ncbi:MAG: hypothetical protein ABJF52_00200, partial [Aurantibacter sp.]
IENKKTTTVPKLREHTRQNNLSGWLRLDMLVPPTSAGRGRHKKTVAAYLANKHLLAIAYNLKKYLKYEQKRVKSGARRLALVALVKSVFQQLFGIAVKHQKIAYYI